MHNAAEAGPQTLYAYGPGRWYVVADHSRTGVNAGSIKSYPCTQKNFGQSIDSFTQITAGWSMRCPPVGEWNASFDVWVNGFGKGSTAEVMIWTDHRYPARIPPGNATESTTVTIDGQPYTAWRRPSHPGGWYIALVMDPKQPTGAIDLLKVFRWLVEKGWLAGADKVSAIEYGVEISNTPAGSPQTFWLDTFVLNTQ